MSAIIVLVIIAAVGYGLWRWKIGPFAPKKAYKSPMQRMGKDPTPRLPPVEPAPAPVAPAPEAPPAP